MIDIKNHTTLFVHIVVGLILLAIMVLNLFGKEANLEPLRINNFRKLAIKINHIGLYILIILIIISGYMIAVKSGIWDMVFYGIEKDIGNLKELKPTIFHNILSKVLMGFIVVHILGVVYYIVSKKENIVKRMWR
jgi:cytochrome b561